MIESQWRNMCNQWLMTTNGINGNDNIQYENGINMAAMTNGEEKKSERDNGPDVKRNINGQWLLSANVMKASIMK